MTTDCTKCVSPSFEDDTIRCPMDAIGSSLFCKHHSALFAPQYRKYKKIESMIPKEIDSSWTYEKLWKVYGDIEKSHNLRIEYRNKAFMQESWDNGHNLQIRRLSDLLEKCTNILLSRQICENEESDSSSDSESESSSEHVKYIRKRPVMTKKLRTTMLEKRQQRIIEQQRWNTELSKYIAENEAYMKHCNDRYIQIEKKFGEVLGMNVDGIIANWEMFEIYIDKLIRFDNLNGSLVTSAHIPIRLKHISDGDVTCNACYKRTKEVYDDKIKAHLSGKEFKDLVANIMDVINMIKEKGTVTARFFLTGINLYKIGFVGSDKSISFQLQGKSKSTLWLLEDDDSTVCYCDNCCPIKCPTFDDIRNIDNVFEGNEEVSYYDKYIVITDVDKQKRYHKRKRALSRLKLKNRNLRNVEQEPDFITLLSYDRNGTDYAKPICENTIYGKRKIDITENAIESN